MFIDITDLYCLTTNPLPSSTITSPKHASSFVKTWRLINAIFTHLHPYPTPSNSSFVFLFSLLPHSVPHGGHVIVESGFIAGHRISARARDDGFTEYVDGGWFELVRRERT